MMSSENNWTDQFIVFRSKESIQRDYCRQTTIDRAWFESLLALNCNETVYISECDFFWWTIPYHSDEETQIVAVVLPRPRFWTAPASPIDETFNFR
jgi:hypothetical protein